MLIPNPEFIQELIHIVNTSPYLRHMSMRLGMIDIDRADIELETGPCHLQPYGIVHGGVLGDPHRHCHFLGGIYARPLRCRPCQH